MFISFEGIEGSGKSTQIQRVRDYLVEKGYRVVVTREPGGTDFGLAIRQLILDPSTHFNSHYTELMLFFADRFEHLASVVIPSLGQGAIVLCDRFLDSTIAYQVGGRGLDREFILQLSAFVSPMPDRTYLLDVPVEVGLERAKNRAELDRFEQEDLAFHQRIRETYLDLASRSNGRIQVVDTQQPQSGVTHAILTDIAQYL